MDDLTAFLLSKKVYKRVENQEIFYSFSSSGGFFQDKRVSLTSLLFLVAIEYFKLTSVLS